ncbi:type II toxin-antitoxin system PemK/MazF family toxin [Candidatus Calescamantes bacterium]|nr:type II toxin-antitoxin system PemK/MazF family toxin [Candidatus Calescamantes bacterium]
MTNYKSGDVVLVEVVFSEGIGSKKRPALVISSNHYNRSRNEVVIAAITSNIKRELFGDTKIENWREAGLIYPSLVTAIVQTIKANMIVKKLGYLSQEDFNKVKNNLRKSMSF